MACEHPRHALVDALFLSGLSPRKQRQLHEHVRGCSECRSYYDRVMVVSRKLDGDRAGLSRAQLALVGGLVLDTATPPRPLGWPALRPLVPWAASVGLALLVLVTAPRLVDTFASGAADEFAARGAAGASLRGAGVGVACVGQDEQDRPFLRGTAKSGGGAELTCKLGDVMHVSYSNAVREPFAYVFVFGVDERGELHWYYPQPEERQSFAAAASAVAEPLPGGVELGATHRAGTVRVMAMFSRAPLLLEDVRARPSSVGEAAVTSVAVRLEE